MSGTPDIGYLVVNPYKAKDSECLKGFMAKGQWTPESERFVKAQGVEALYLNIAKGWKGTDYSFLRSLTDLKELDIIAAGGEQLSAIESLRRLRTLSLTCLTRETLDLSGLGELRDCFISWWKGLKGLPSLKQLQRLHLEKPSPDACAELRQLSGLNSLTISNTSVTDLGFLQGISALKKLELLNCRKLLNFNPITPCPHLTWLRIEGSKGLKKLDFISHLASLEILLIGDNGAIETLAPLSGLTNLKAVAFQGSTTQILDGDLSVFEKLPRLAMLMFAPRRHYTHKLIKPWNWHNVDTPDRLLERKRLI